MADLGLAGDAFDDLGLDHAFHGGLHVVEELIDDLVEADLDVAFLRFLADAGIRPDIEAEDDRVRSARKEDVVIADGSGASEKDADLDGIGAHLLEVVLEGLGRAVAIGLDDDVHVLDLAGVDEVVEVGKCHRGGARTFLGLLGKLALLGDFLGLAFLGEGHEFVPGAWDGAEANDRHGGARAGGF